MNYSYELPATFYSCFAPREIERYIVSTIHDDISLGGKLLPFYYHYYSYTRARERYIVSTIHRVAARGKNYYLKCYHVFSTVVPMGCGT